MTILAAQELAGRGKRLRMVEQTSSSECMATIEEMERRISDLERRLDRCSDTNSLSMVVFSGELDRLLAAFVIATGAAACGMQVSMFFTFWGTAALKKNGGQVPGKTVMERMFGWMLPGGLDKRKLSKMDLAGLGRCLIKREMKKKGTPDLASLIGIAGELGVNINICEMSMSLMGIKMEELIDYPNMKMCGVATFLGDSTRANTTLFI